MATKMFLAILLLTSTALAHVEMTFPPPLRSKFNKNLKDNQIDYTQNSPLEASQFPCKGYLSDLGTSAGAAVASFPQGGNVSVTLSGSATHLGGSCQISMSTDKGKSWFVIHSYEGGCPLSLALDVNIPTDAPIGDALFGWTWINNTGNREFYMQCAAITITAGSGPAPAIAFASRPDMFVANLQNGCETAPSTDVIYPDPGPDVTHLPTSAKQQAPVGVCAALNGIGLRKSSTSPANLGAAVGVTASLRSSSATATSTASDLPASSTITTSITPPLKSATFTTSITPPLETGVPYTGPNTTTTDGKCSGVQTCAGQTEFGSCCSKWGYCGSTTLHCGEGCQSAFGACGVTGNSTATAGKRHVRQFKS